MRSEERGVRVIEVRRVREQGAGLRVGIVVRYLRSVTRRNGNDDEIGLTSSLVPHVRPLDLSDTQVGAPSRSAPRSWSARPRWSCLPSFASTPMTHLHAENDETGRGTDLSGACRSRQHVKHRHHRQTNVKLGENHIRSQKLRCSPSRPIHVAINLEAP